MSALFDILEQVKEIDPRARVLITSYKFNPDFFEKHIFSHFHGWSYPLLFIDAAEYQEVGKSLQHSKFAGSRYFIESISCTKTFHPKVMFALSDNQALILVGSNNLTWSGYTQSAEVVTPIVVDFERPERAYLLDDFVDFLEGLSDFVGSQTYREHLQEIIHSIPKLNIAEERNAWLLHSINKIPLLDQISNVIREPILKISVVSPYFAQDREFYQKMSDLCPDIHFFVQQKTSNLPVKILGNFDTFTYHSFLIDNGRFLHAKILFIETDSDNYVFSGSANFSSSALITNANIEMGLLVKGDVQFQEIIKAIGKTQEISLEEVESQTVDSEILGVSPSTMKVVEAVLVGGSIAVTLESLDSALEYTVRLNGEEFSLSYTIDGSTLYFDVNEQILSLFDKSVVLSIVSKNGNELHESNMRIVYNKKIFPAELDMLNYWPFDDANWLFAVLSKLLKLRDPTPYLRHLTAIVDSEVLVSAEKEGMLSECHFNVGAYNPDALLGELIDRCVVRHHRRIECIDTLLDTDAFGIIVNSLLLTNKLVIWSVSHRRKDYNELKIVMRNLANFFEDKGVAQTYTSESVYKSCATQIYLAYHAATLVYVLDHLQMQSGEFEPLPHLGFNPTKGVFERVTVAALSKAIEFETNVFVESEFSKIFDQYREIVPSLRQISLPSIQIRLNDIIQQVNERESKKYPLVEFR